MDGEFGHITRCFDLRDTDIAAAMAGRDSARALLAHLSAVSAPDTGVAKVLLVFARMATTACEWLDGDLAVEITGEGASTRVDVATELGGGLRERVLPPIELAAPMDELIRAIERVPHMIAPLVVASKSKTRIVLAATALVRKTSVPPPPIEISAESLFVRVPPPSTPKEGAETPGVPLPVVASSGLPVVGGAAAPKPASTPAAAGGPSDPPPDVDSGWDD